MKKGMTISIILVLVLVAAIFYFSSVSFGALVCDKYNSEPNKLGCMSNLAIKKINPEICDNLLDVQIKELCYSRYASASKDLNICNELKTSVKNTCIQDVAVSLGDSAVCKESFENKNLERGYIPSCYTAVAVEIKDDNPCYSIKEFEEDSYYFDICILRVAKNMRDKELCDNISTLELKEECQEI